MQYFQLSSGHYARSLEVNPLSQRFVLKRILTKAQARTLEDCQILSVSSQAVEPYPDVISQPIYAVSNGVKLLLAQYDRSLVFKLLPIIEKQTGRRQIYWIMGLDEIECLSSQTIYDKRGQVAEPVLDQSKIAGKAIFTLGGTLGHYLIVRLDAAESLLRRPFYGIALTPVRTEQDEGEMPNG